MLQQVKKYFKKIIGSGSHAAVQLDLTPKESKLISKIRSRRLTYLSDKKLASIARTCRSIEEANLPGVFLEAGCALGGSAILIGSVKSSDRPLYVYDVFGMIPPPTKEDSQDVHDRYKTIVNGASKGLVVMNIMVT